MNCAHLKSEKPARFPVRSLLFLVAASVAVGLLLPAASAQARTPGELWVTPHFSMVSGEFSHLGAKKPSPTQAGTDDAAPVRSYGPNIEVGAALSIDDFFAILLVGDFSYQLSGMTGVPDTPPQDYLITSVSTGFRYTFDVFKYVPYAVVTVGAASIHNIPQKDNTWEVLATVGLGLNYRINRDWSVGADAKYRLFISATSDFPSQLLVGLKATWHFSVGF